MSDSTLLGDQLIPSTRKEGWTIKKKIGLGVMILCVVGLLATAIIIGVASKNSDRGFHRKINVDAIMGHLNKFQEAANENSNSRGVLEGYNATVEYVLGELSKKTDCTIERDYFRVPVFYSNSDPVLSLVAPIELSYQHGIDYTILRYGGDGEHDVTRDVSEIENDACDEDDFQSFPEGNICLIQYSSSGCTPLQKALNCENAGGSAVIFYNSYERKTLGGFLRNSSYFEGDPLLYNIPAISVTYSVGNTFKSLINPTVNLKTNTSIIMADTSNIYCITKEGDEENTVVAGAHLDSVPAGPGINDNGSGSASLLEIVIQFYQQKIKPTNRVIFGFWGAEELGLLGSRYYANKLETQQPEEFKKIAMALNFDMLGSPNYIPYTNVFEGSPGLPESIRNGSNVITRTFGEYFDDRSVPYKTAIMNGGSDYYSFAERGIPAGGLETGAGSFKTEEERKVFGGLANAPFDPCYHLSCDTTENINLEGLEIMSQGAAYAIHKFATMKDIRETLAKG